MPTAAGMMPHAPATADAAQPDARSDAASVASAPAAGALNVAAHAGGAGASVHHGVYYAPGGGGAPGAAGVPADAEQQEVSPHSTPSSTPLIERRSDTFTGPTLALFEPHQPNSLFERRDPMQAQSALSPGHEALPVASLAHFQSAMLGSVVQPQAALGGAPAHDGGAAGAADALSDGASEAPPRRRSYLTGASVSSILGPREDRTRNADHRLSGQGRRE